MNALWAAANAFLCQVLTWVGIIGGAITLFATLQGVLNLASWAGELVGNWHEWTLAVWQLALGWTGIKLSREWIPPLSFSAFSIVAAFGARRVTDSSQRESSAPISRVLLGAALFAAYAYCVGDVISDEQFGWLATPAVASIAIVACAVIIVAVMHQQACVSSIAFVCLLSILYSIIFAVHGERAFLSASAFFGGSFRGLSLIPASSGVPWLTLHTFLVSLLTALAFTLPLYVLPVMVLAIAGIEALTVRLLFLLIGLLILIGLNELSGYAPEFGSG